MMFHPKTPIKSPSSPVTGQVEYWATLGRSVEHGGLTAQEAQTAIANYAADGNLAQQARDVVAKGADKENGSTITK